MVQLCQVQPGSIQDGSERDYSKADDEGDDRTSMVRWDVVVRGWDRIGRVIFVLAAYEAREQREHRNKNYNVGRLTGLSEYRRRNAKKIASKIRS